MGCPHQGKTLQEMSPKEKATWMMSIYNSQYDDYQLQVVRTDLTETERKVLRYKKEVFSEVFPAIELYAGYANSGVIPGDELETLIISRLNQLMMNLAE